MLRRERFRDLPLDPGSYSSVSELCRRSECANLEDVLKLETPGRKKQSLSDPSMIGLHGESIIRSGADN